MSTVVPVILCGGSGTRLWPLSTADKPKQLLNLVGERSMLQDTLLRAAALGLETAPPVIVCNARHGAAVAAQAAELGATLGAVVLEPAGRNSAPAATVAALSVRAMLGDGIDPLLLMLPADHVIAEPETFASAVRTAVEPAKAGYLTTFGVVPTGPATGYGYVRCGVEHAGWSEVAEFVEKPDLATARAYVESKRYLWNSGMFLFAASAWLDELRARAPAMLEACEGAFESAERADGFLRLDDRFRSCPADSIDYAVMEKTSKAAVVPLSAGWSDVGSWSSLHDVLPKDAEGNTATGNAVLDACRDTYVAAHGRRVVAIGLSGVVIVETADAVLVVSRDSAESVKRVADLVTKRS